MNSFGDMRKNRILTLTPFSHKRLNGNFLQCRLLAMYVMCGVHEKRRCAICRSADIVIYVCTYLKCRFDL